MNCIYINKQFKDYIYERFPQLFEENRSNWWGRGDNWWKRKIVFHGPLSQENDPDSQVFYVLGYDKKENTAYIDLKIRKDINGEDFEEMAVELKKRCPDCDDFYWKNDRTYRYRQIIYGWEYAVQGFTAIIDKTKDAIEDYIKEEQTNSIFERNDIVIEDDSEVSPHTMTLQQLLSLNLNIPEYQRIYCWDERTIRTLWKDIKDMDAGEHYRLGTIILQKVNDHYDIIDGQQRLVTLSLILLELHISDIPLLQQKYDSATAEDFISYNKYIIENILKSVKRSSRRGFAKLLWSNIDFNVLVLNDSSIDLAYTFFSNENSRGKALSDFDLLKAHHLRFISDNEKQSMHLAQKWDKMILHGMEASAESEKDYVRTLGLYIYRLRHWIRNSGFDDDSRHKIKQEYEAALQIPEIPPFGEHFFWNESIQGGSHFFGYVDEMLAKFKSFSGTPAFCAIHMLDSETHWWYRDVIESLLFDYYLKFGESYLSEALFLITGMISVHRLNSGRTNLRSILQFASDTNIVKMVDRASSPTFFLAELLSAVQEIGNIRPTANIHYRYQDMVYKCMHQCINTLEIDTIANLYK